MIVTNVFLSLGGNIGDTKTILKKTIAEIVQQKNIILVKTSNYYKTSPISDLKQRYFINCICHIKTSYDPFSLLKKLQTIEKKIGKKNKPQNMPRIIDIDIIFFNDLSLKTKTLILPHPEWLNRLFVLKPLSELRKRIVIKATKRTYFDLNSLIKNFKNTNNQKVAIID